MNTQTTHRPSFLKHTLTFALVAAASIAAQASAKPLDVQVYNNHDPKGFQVSSVLISGAKDAILLDAQFTLPDAQKLVEQIKASGKTLKTVFITSGDPDYYFGLGVVKAAFPEAKILTTPAILKHINETVDGKLATWGSQMGDLVPKTATLPEAYTGNRLMLEGKEIRIKHGVGEKNAETYVYIPSIKTVAGGVLVFGHLHLWTADSQTLKVRQDWAKSLKAIAALKPKTVIPGHFQQDAPTNLASVTYSQHYLTTFEKELKQSANAAALIQSMTQKYPNAGLGVALDIGAKVNKGEMQWH
ncbi:hypothetical protein DTO96_101320 [Ephemeroptericola cinctiostellae]|uniref:Metallo-beta-lactamase domain-containing protein n=1 Tax=Ephemeroptericola cinctiostellae TaxID=2268024 RepID=A0A345DB51_9BURK|nr:MBL fold metallo-hydrolase [Ephemeroptericola cinctiostellae]AXF85589.1 hypothetical protein DTO96_101320 [Ephemeroptericola cinctiostellae]